MKMLILASFEGLIKVTWLRLRHASLRRTCWATLFPISLASLQGPRASFGFITQCCPLLIYHPCSALAEAIWNSLAFLDVIFRTLETETMQTGAICLVWVRDLYPSLAGDVMMLSPCRTEQQLNWSVDVVILLINYLMTQYFLFS